MDTKQSSEKRFALLIDADNVSAKYIKPITDELSKYGTVTYKRIYGDWTLTLHAKWKDALLENSITPIQQFGYTQGKNATDSAMIIDAMDILYTRSVEGFCIVSSDSDFTRLASRIRDSGLTVIGMGEKKTPVPFRKACDIFTTLELLLPGSGNGKGNGRSKGKPEQGGSGQAQGQGGTGPTIDEIERAVVNIITDNQNNGKSTGLGEVGSRLLKRYPDFDVRSYGTNLLSKLLDEFQSVQITKDGSSVTVELSEGKDAHDRPEPVGRERADDAETRPAERDADVAAERHPGQGGKASRAARGPKKAAEKSSPDARPADGGPEEPAPDPIGQDAAAAGTAEQKGSKGNRTLRVRSQRPARSETASGGRDGQSAENGDDERRQPTVDNRPGRAGRKKATASRASSAPSSEPGPGARGSRPAQAAASAGPEELIRQSVREAGEDGVELSVLGKRVRARFRSFKLRDLGYTQLRAFVADLEGIEVEKRGKDFYARQAK